MFPTQKPSSHAFQALQAHDTVVSSTLNPGCTDGTSPLELEEPGKQKPKSLRGLSDYLGVETETAVQNS